MTVRKIGAKAAKAASKVLRDGRTSEASRRQRHPLQVSGLRAEFEVQNVSTRVWHT